MECCTNLDLTIGLDVDIHFIGKLEIMAAAGAMWFGDEGSGSGLRYCLSHLGSNECSPDISQYGLLFLCQVESTAG